MEENQEQKQPEQNEEQKQPEQKATSVEELIKSFDEKLNKMQEENNKKLAEKDEIIKQLILNKNNGDEELTEDEQSIQKITKNINKRR